jgi:hypothetical protein
MVSENLTRFCRHVLMEIKMEEKWRTVCISGVTRYVAEKGILPTQIVEKNYTRVMRLFPVRLELMKSLNERERKPQNWNSVCRFPNLRIQPWSLVLRTYSKFAKCLILSNDETQLISTWIYRYFLYINVYLIKLQLIPPLQGLGPLYWN